MRKLLAIFLFGIILLMGCSKEKKQENTTESITLFDTFSQSMNMGENTLSLKFYTNDLEEWKEGVENASITIGYNVIEASKVDVSMDDTLVDGRYYVGGLSFTGDFPKCSGEANISLVLSKGEELSFTLGNIAVCGGQNIQNDYFRIVSSEAISKTSAESTTTYGLIVRIQVYKDVRLWGLRMGLEHIFADTSMIYEIPSEDVNSVLSLNRLGTLDSYYTDCYKLREGNDSCMMPFDLMAGEHYLYIPFQYEAGYYPFKSNVFNITYDAYGVAPAECITEEFDYFYN